jgi:hypothetical protein
MCLGDWPAHARPALRSVPPGLPWRSLRLGCSFVAPTCQPLQHRSHVCTCCYWAWLWLCGSHITLPCVSGILGAHACTCMHACMFGWSLCVSVCVCVKKKKDVCMQDAYMRWHDIQIIRLCVHGSGALVKSLRCNLRCAGWSQNGQHVSRGLACACAACSEECATWAALALSPPRL